MDNDEKILDKSDPVDTINKLLNNEIEQRKNAIDYCLYHRPDNHLMRWHQNRLVKLQDAKRFINDCIENIDYIAWLTDTPYDAHGRLERIHTLASDILKEASK